MSHVDVKNLKPTQFEDEYYDEYEYYNLSDKYTGEKEAFIIFNLPLDYVKSRTRT